MQYVGASRWEGHCNFLDFVSGVYLSGTRKNHSAGIEDGDVSDNQVTQDNCRRWRRGQRYAVSRVDKQQGLFYINPNKTWANVSWIKLCGRPHSQLNVTTINEDVYIC